MFLIYFFFFETFSFVELEKEHNIFNNILFYRYVEFIVEELVYEK